MTKKITIAIDAMGGENAPEKTVHGSYLFVKKSSYNSTTQEAVVSS